MRSFPTRRSSVLDVAVGQHRLGHLGVDAEHRVQRHHRVLEDHGDLGAAQLAPLALRQWHQVAALEQNLAAGDARSEEHTSELQSLMRISYAVFCLKKKNYTKSSDSHMRES